MGDGFIKLFIMITINREIACDYYARFLNPIDNSRNVYVKYVSGSKLSCPAWSAQSQWPSWMKWRFLRSSTAEGIYSKV